MVDSFEQREGTRLVYLDHAATTPCDPRVVAAMLPYFTEVFADPTGAVHVAGRAAYNAIEEARELVASLIGAFRKEIVFTSGATESNNLALIGLSRSAPSGRRRIVTSALEHRSVLAACRDLARTGFDVVELPVDRWGIVDLAAAEAAIDERTLMVSIQAANGEVGTVQPVAILAALAHKHGALMHCDAAQALGKIPVDINEWSVDLLSLSAHKCFGPKGSGALYLRGGPHALPVRPLILGGGQEHGMRAGVPNVPGIVGFGEACRIASASLPAEAARTRELRDDFERDLLERCPWATINCGDSPRLPGVSSVTIADVDAEALVVNMPDFAIGTGAACTVGAPEPPPTLLAIGRSGREAYATIRVSFGRFNTIDDPSLVAAAICEAAGRLRMTS